MPQTMAPEQWIVFIHCTGYIPWLLVGGRVCVAGTDAVEARNNARVTRHIPELGPSPAVHQNTNTNTRTREHEQKISSVEVLAAINRFFCLTNGSGWLISPTREVKCGEFGP
ncbi:hypothetical protein FA95DRAFT_1103667 [Auriscalpium vulgare]|uniref:Uncharacterized protein n=1 Tax=Auriscalpium vulgare TaxID=40419 RepID=A0ACB8R507_9AGAM|nr:hypothetical protein FA95DRAFT_1103667 [Auriscalpium vulgare]